MEQIFKVGDTVYHWKYGKGSVEEANPLYTFAIKVIFSNNFIKSFTSDGEETLYEPPTLSHTPYDLVNGGFFQRKPLPNIKKGTPVFVRDFDDSTWDIRPFSHFSNDGTINTFKIHSARETISWRQYSLENPINYKD